MIRRNNYWIFFAILAVGLALSWAQVGKRAQLSKNAKLSVMSLDEDCHPWRTPCAAYATNFALVLGVDSRGGLRLLGEQLPDSIELKLMHFKGAVELPVPDSRRIDARQWLIVPSKKIGRLRVNLQLDDRQWIAEFPLQYLQ